MHKAIFFNGSLSTILTSGSGCLVTLTPEQRAAVVGGEATFVDEHGAESACAVLVESGFCIVVADDPHHRSLRVVTDKVHVLADKVVATEHVLSGAVCEHMFPRLFYTASQYVIQKILGSMTVVGHVLGHGVHYEVPRLGRTVAEIEEELARNTATIKELENRLSRDHDSKFVVRGYLNTMRKL